MHRYAHASLRLAIIFMAGAAIIYAFFGAPIASIFTPDPAVIKVARNLFFVVAVFEIFDGLQVTALGALRGITDVQRPMLYALISYLLVAVPACIRCRYSVKFRGSRFTFRILWRPHVCRYPIHPQIQQIRKKNSIQADDKLGFTIIKFTILFYIFYDLSIPETVNFKSKI